MLIWKVISIFFVFASAFYEIDSTKWNSLSTKEIIKFYIRIKFCQVKTCEKCAKLINIKIKTKIIKVNECYRFLNNVRIIQCESGFIESPLSEINCWFFSDCWVRPHTSNHLCLPSRDWPVFWIRNFVYFCWPIRRRKTKMIRRVGANPAIWISPFCRFRVIWLSMIKDSYGRQCY